MLNICSISLNYIGKILDSIQGIYWQVSDVCINTALRSVAKHQMTS